MPPSAALIRFQDVSLGYGARTVLSELTFSILDGDLIGLVGPNGAGKTTVLRGILGSMKPKTGRIHGLAGLRFGYVPQRSTLDYTWPLDTLSVVMMGTYDRIGLFKRPGQRERQLGLEALAQVGLQELAERPFTSLSGGQKQRVLIARALIGKPNVLVLDEPTDGMDLVSTNAILGLVRTLHQRERLTVIVVSHQLNEVANYVKRIALVTEGKFQIGELSEILTEKNLTDLYGIPVEVDQINGKRMVFARAAGGSAIR